MQLNTLQWVGLDSSIRSELVEIFDIPRSGYTIVEGQEVITDGYTNQDLTSITVEKMQEYLDSTETEYFDLFKEVLQKILSKKAKEAEKAIEEKKEVTVEIHGEGVVLPDGTVKTTKVEIIKNTNPELKNEGEENKQIEGTNPLGNVNKAGNKSKAKKS